MDSILLDLVMIGLLGGVIVVSYRLNAKLQNLRKMEGEVGPVLQHFSVMMNQITQKVERLKQSTEELHGKISQQLPKAQVLRDDLHYLMEHGERLAKKLDHIIETNKTRPQNTATQEERVIISLRSDEQSTDPFLSKLKGIR